MRNNKNKTTDFDFDYWVALAKKSPENFDKVRSKVVTEFIDDSPTYMHRRLRGLQWRVDMEIRRSQNSTDACLRIYKMMMSSVYAPGGLLEALNSLLEFDGHPTTQTTDQSDASVIPLTLLERNSEL